MKLISQSFEILEQKDFTLKGIKQFIEKCSRVRYKSESITTDNSYIKFVDNLIKSDRARCLEFGTVHLKISSGMLFEEFLQDLLDYKLYNPVWIKYKELPEYTYITTNYRHCLQIIKECPYIVKYLTEEDNEYYPKRYTVHFIISRGIMDEFRTHVCLSHLAESLIYCSYNEDKFDNELTFIIPNWVNTNCPTKEKEGPSVASIKWSTAMSNAEDNYMNLIKMGCIAQEAREVLPLSVKSELISCGFEDAWSNFFYRRCDNAAHPMVRKLACALKEEFIKRNYINGN